MKTKCANNTTGKIENDAKLRKKNVNKKRQRESATNNSNASNNNKP